VHGVMISHALDIPFKAINVTPSVPLVFVGENILVVDDLVDSGKTLSLCHSDIAVLYKKPTSIKEPTFWVGETDKWVVFPYEKGKD